MPDHYETPSATLEALRCYVCRIILRVGSSVALLALRMLPREHPARIYGAQRIREGRATLVDASVVDVRHSPRPPMALLLGGSTIVYTILEAAQIVPGPF